MKFLSTFLSAAAVVSSATALLLPPDTANVEAFKPASSSVVEINCPGCPFAVGEENGNYFWGEQLVDSVLLMNFSLTGDKILLNDRVLHPMEFPHLHAFYAVQVRKSESDSLPKQSIPVRMGYALESAPHTERSGQTWFNLQYTVFDLAGRQVHIDTVKISFAYDKQGQIPLMVLDTIPVDQPGSPGSIGKDCKNSLCRMRAMIIAKIKEAFQKAKDAAEAAKNSAKNSKPVAWVKGCHNKFRGGRPHHHGRPDHANKPNPHHKHHGHNHLRYRIRRFVRAIIVPVILGICAGMTAGALGMLVGHALAFLWIKYVRGGRRGPYAQVSQQEEEAIPEEKEGLINELPPNYEELEGDVKLADDKN